MRILLDTCTFLWASAFPENLSAKAKKICLDTKNDLYLSSISVWEIVLKYGLKKLNLPYPPEVFIPEQRKILGIEELKFDEVAALALRTLPRKHQDPFDRMLICQAITHNLTILTPDRHIAQYSVKTII